MFGNILLEMMLVFIEEMIYGTVLYCIVLEL